MNIPPSLRPLTGGRKVVYVPGSTVGEALRALEARFPALRARLRDAHGRLRPHLLIYLNDEDIRARQGEHTPVAPGDTIGLTPTIEGG